MVCALNVVKTFDFFVSFPSQGIKIAAIGRADRAEGHRTEETGGHATDKGILMSVVCAQRHC